MRDSTKDIAVPERKPFTKEQVNALAEAFTKEGK